MHRILGLVGGAGALLAAFCFTLPARSAEPKVSFHRDVRPILQRHCSGCHSSALRAGRLSVVTFAALKSGGAGGPGFIPARPEDSPLFKFVSGKSPTMPKDAPPLKPREVETLRQWIVQGGHDDTPLPRDPISQERPPVYTSPPVVSAVAYSPDGELLAVSGYREVLLHKADGSGLAARLVGRSQRVESLAFSPDGKLLAAVGGNPCLFGELQIWDLAARKLVKSVEVGYDVLYGVSFAPNGKLVAFGGAEKSAYLYSVPEGEQLIKFDGHSDWVFGTTFSKDSKNFISTSRDKAIKLVEIATKNFVDDINYQVYKGGYYAVARNPVADEVAVGGEEGLARYYTVYKQKARTMNREDHNLLRVFEKLDGPVFALAFSPDGSMLAMAGRSAEIRVFKTAEASLVTKLKGHRGSIHTLAWHPRGAQLAAAGFDGTVRLYAMPSGELTKEFVPVPVTGGRQALGSGR